MLKKRLLIVEKLVFCLLVFLIPTQLAIHFWPSFAFVFGIRVDYLAPTIYLTDLLVFMLFVMWGVRDGASLVKFLKTKRTIVYTLLIFLFVNTVFSTNVWISFIRWGKVLEMFFLGLYVYTRKDFVKERLLIMAVFVSSVFFSLIGILQFFQNKTSGLFYFLGERTFNITTPGIALVKLNGQDFIRTYSTFPHPNALAGYLGVALMIIFVSGLWKENVIKFLGTLIVFFCMVLTFSSTAFVGMLAVLFLYFLRSRKKTLVAGVKVFLFLSIILSLFLPILSGQKNLKVLFSKNITERLDLAALSGKMISESFAFGKGLNTFIFNIPRGGYGLSTPWLLQPVHNIYLLVFAETGVVGLLVFLWLIVSLLKKILKSGKVLYIAVIVFILVTGTMDHYWLTIQQNLLLASILIGAVLRNISKID